jgi:hypothetical protein
MLNAHHLLEYVAWVVDDAGCGRHPGADEHAKVTKYSTLVGWQCGFEPLVVAVNSYLPGVMIEADEAVDLATDLLDEKRWFSDGPVVPDFVFEAPLDLEKPNSETAKS